LCFFFFFSLFWVKSFSICVFVYYYHLWWIKLIIAVHAPAWKNSQTVKATAENVHLWYKHKLADVYTIHRIHLMYICVQNFIIDCLLQPMLHVNIRHPLLQFVDIAILFLALLYCFPNFIVIGFRLEQLRRPYIMQGKFWGLTCNGLLKSATNVIFKFDKVV